MRLPLVFLSILPLTLILAGCATPSAPPQVATYNLWRSGDAPDTFGCRVSADTRPELAALLHSSLAPAGLYEDAGNTALELGARLDVGAPLMRAVARWSPEWKNAPEERRFVEIIDRYGKAVVVRASHPDAGHGSRWAVLMSRSTLLVEARHKGQPVWCAEIVLEAAEDAPEKLAPMFSPAVVEVLFAAVAQSG